MERAAWDELRHRFPLHLLVFKQTASHLPHEANVEQFFSRAGNLADPNQKPHHLAALVTAGVNRTAYNPPVEAIRSKYFEMFRGKGDTVNEQGQGDQEPEIEAQARLD